MMPPKLTLDQQEQGTPLAHYEERGPYHCEDCVHKVHPNVPICIHPMVIADPKMKDKVCWTDSPTTENKGVFIDLEKGCCGYVRQEKPDDGS